jgi:hypothetical protein
VKWKIGSEEYASEKRWNEEIPTDWSSNQWIKSKPTFD